MLKGEFLSHSALNAAVDMGYSIRSKAREFSAAHISRNHRSKLGTHAAFTRSVPMCVCNGAR